MRKELGELGVRVIRLGTRARPDALRQGPARRPGGQAGRDPLREHRPDAAQLRRHRSPGALEEVGTAGRGDRPRSPAPPSGTTCRARTRSCSPAGCSSRASRRSSASRRRRSRASIPTSAPIPATGGGCTGRCTSSRTSTSTWPTRRATWPRTRCRSRTSCSSSTGRARSGSSRTWPPSVEELDSGRSFGNGKQMFQVASCVACHKLDGVGSEIGPDLTKLDPKLTSRPRSSRDILEPSLKINEKYQTYVFETEVGQGRHRADPRGDAGRRSR